MTEESSNRYPDGWLEAMDWWLNEDNTNGLQNNHLVEHEMILRVAELPSEWQKRSDILPVLPVIQKEP